MNPHRSKWPITMLLCLGLLLTTACGEDDPEETTTSNGMTSNTTTGTSNGTTTSNGATSNGTSGLTCADACAQLTACAEIGAECPAEVSGSLGADCAAACAADPAVILGAADSLECAALAPILSDALGAGEMCAFGGCAPLDSDYAPGVEDDQWPACISDGGTYNRIQPTISSIGRIAGYEQIADLLWRRDTPPTSDDFLMAREIYAVDEGLDSRVQRREDEHYPAVTDGEGNTLRCRDEGVPAMDPKRCVGPGLILPILNEAFNNGITGSGTPEVEAARVDAALLWFMYVSSHKEAVTCTTTKKDCDSAYAYYTGGEPRESGFGLAKAIKASSGWAHERIWDGILAVRCWRDLDGAEEATDLATRDLAISQLDEGLLYGLSRMIQDRLLAMTQHTGAARDADWAWLQIMGGVLDREASVRDAAAATILRDAFAAGTPPADVEPLIAALNGLFTCP